MEHENKTSKAKNFSIKVHRKLKKNHDKHDLGIPKCMYQSIDLEIE